MSDAQRLIISIGHLGQTPWNKGIVLNDLHEVAKREFNGHEITVDGKNLTVGRSSKGRELGPFVERVIAHLVDNYGIDPTEVLNPTMYKLFINTEFMRIRPVKAALPSEPCC